MTSEAQQSRSPIRVALIEDQQDFREALALLISSSEGYACAQQYGSMEEALEGLPRDLPDLVLADIGLPGLSGIDGIRLLKQRYPVLPTLMLTVYNDDERIFAAMCAGACGYLLKNTTKTRLLECIREVVGGGAAMSPEVARRVIELFRQFNPPPQATYHLSPQETRLLKLLAEGHHYKTAAGELGITVNTVSTHMRHIYEKLQVHSESEAVAKAFRQGLIH